MVFDAQELLSRGFLPAELPPAFTSRTLGQAAAALFRVSSGQLKVPVAICLDHAKKQNYRLLPTPFNLARQGSLRRRLQIPHPLAYANLCQVIEAQSGCLTAALERSSWSCSFPKANKKPNGGRALERSLKDEAIVEVNAKVRATSRFLLVTDISQFYHSIYTHTFSWSLGGKDAAKALAKSKGDAKKALRLDPNFQDAELGDQLDKAVRTLQDGQSVGLPIGPDASLILAEVLLCGLDEKLKAALDEQQIPFEAIRNVDDYQIGFRTKADAEQALNLLQKLLRTELELSLNPRKTRIVTLPEPLEEPWVTQLKGIFRESMSTDRQKRRDLLRLFDLAVAARANYPEAHVFSYLMGVLRNVDLGKNWPLLEHILIQMALAESGAFRSMLTDLLWYQSQGKVLDKVRWHQVFEQIIVTHAPQEHSSEVVWALWGLWELDLSLSSVGAEALRHMEDPIVAVLVLALGSNGRIDASEITLLKAEYQTRISPENFWSEQWPLVYEATHQGWLELEPELLIDPGYKLLHEADVTFLDMTRRLDPTTLTQKKLGYESVPRAAV